MATKIFISGGGDIQTSRKFDGLFFDSLKYNSRILYIPVAMGTTTSVIERCYDWFSSLISEHHDDKNIDFQILKDVSQDMQLSLYDAVYIGGGNTYRLLAKIIEGHFDKKLVAYIIGGGLYYGGSAGGIIMGKSLLTVVEESMGRYKEDVGLNLLGGYSIFPHYDDSQLDEVNGIGKKYSLDILAIPEDSGVVFVGGNMETVGEVRKVDSNEN